MITHPAAAAPAKTVEAARRVTTYEMLGETSFPTSSIFAGTTLGGLPGITYDSRSRSCHAISDDRSQLNPARFYTMGIDIADGDLLPG